MATTEKEPTEPDEKTDAKEPEDKKETKPKKEPKVKKEKTGPSLGKRVSQTVNKFRGLLAQIIWLLFVLAALFLAVGALLIALKANPGNDLVKFIVKGADRVDLGVFSRTDGIKQFGGDNADIKNALFNWGLGAVAWLVVGRIVDRIIKP